MPDTPTDIPPKPSDPGVPLGTVRERFWQRSVTQGALVVTIGLALTVKHGYMTGHPVSPETLSTAIDGVVYAWLGAFGIHLARPGIRVG